MKQVPGHVSSDKSLSAGKNPGGAAFVGWPHSDM